MGTLWRGNSPELNNLFLFTKIQPIRNIYITFFFFFVYSRSTAGCRPPSLSTILFILGILPHTPLVLSNFTLTALLQSSHYYFSVWFPPRWTLVIQRFLSHATCPALFHLFRATFSNITITPVGPRICFSFTVSLSLYLVGLYTYLVWIVPFLSAIFYLVAFFLGPMFH